MRSIWCSILFILLAMPRTSCAGYKTYAEIVDALNNLAAGSAGYAQAFDAGDATNGTKIRAIVVSKAAAVTNTAKPDVVIVGTIHAREWIAAEVCLAIAKDLIDNRDNAATVIPGFRDMSYQKLLENVEIVIIPVLNPEGYTYSRNPGGSPDDNDPAWPGHLFKDWRKNQRDTSTLAATARTDAGAPGDVGVDCNRNFPFQWDPPINASKDPTHYFLYRGPDPSSEDERRECR